MAPIRLVQVTSSHALPLSGRDDDALMTLAQAGSREAFAVLVERHAQRIVQVCGRFTDDVEHARELAQCTWVMVWERRASYRRGSDFLLWVVTVARNRCRNEVR